LSTPQSFSPAPTMGTEPAWRLGVTALSRANGNVVLYVAVPGAGTLTARARGSLLVGVRGSSSARRSSCATRRLRRSACLAPRAARSSHTNLNATTHRGARPLAVATRTLAIAGQNAHAPAGELIMLVLKLDKAYAGLAAQPGGLSANASLMFTARGEPTLHASIAVAFQRTATVRRSSKGAARAHRDTRR
ncbi:MAG: hypothetical protein ABSH36_06750, partial [Solirubrobacteraceae bacterium]